jgi:hypothetical protein
MRAPGERLGGGEPSAADATAALCRSAPTTLLASDDGVSHPQVGGHHDVIRFEGAIARKKLLKGDQEAKTLEVLAQHALLREYVPAFIRIQRRISSDSAGDDAHDWLVMSNVCAGFRSAACMVSHS